MFFVTLLCYILIIRSATYNVIVYKGQGKDAKILYQTVNIVLFAMTTASMMGVNTIFINFFPLRYEAIGKVSTVSGFMNGMAYVGTAVSTFTIGVLVEQKGWNVTIGSWVVMTFLALVVCMLGRKKFS